MRPRLISRSVPGLTVPIHPPAGDARSLILRELASTLSIDLAGPLLQQLDAGLPDQLSVRGLLSAVKQIDLWCRMNDQVVSSAAIQSAIDSTTRGRRDRVEQDHADRRQTFWSENQ